MYIKSLELTDFRNYKTLDLEFGKKVNLIIGENAQGKTNLIEAIYMLGFARSFRTARDTEVISFGENKANIIADVRSENINNKVNIEIRNEGKFVKCNGKRITKTKELLDKVYVVIFSPEDLKLVKDVPEKRRKFIDSELSKIKPSYFDSISNYNKTLKQRNAYLKEMEIRRDILEIWDNEIAVYGKKVIEKRREFIKLLEETSSEIHNSISGGKEKLTLEYEASIKKEEEYIDILTANFDKDVAAGTTTKGPHRDDIKICIDGVDIRHFGSQGQQRTAALSLKLAEVILIKKIIGENAILLLDDVLSELDISRQEYLINTLEDIQMFITAADISDEVTEKIKEKNTYEVVNGTVSMK